MTKQATWLRLTTVTAGALVLIGLASAGVANAADDPFGHYDIDVNVQLTEIDEPGILAMSLRCPFDNIDTCKVPTRWVY